MNGLHNGAIDEQDRAMIWRYIELIFSFAFRRTTPTIDGLQILAASGLPAIAKIAGLQMPASATSDAFAYIGLAAVTFILLRLICAPYFIWRDQIREIDNLSLDLKKPERQEFAKLAEIRAEAKAELAYLTSHMLFVAARYNPKRDKSRIAAMVDSGIALCARGNVSRSFDSAFTTLSRACFDLLDAPKKPSEDSYIPTDLVNDMLAYLHGDITGETLALRLPPDTSREIRP